MCTVAYMWRSEVNLRELVLFPPNGYWGVELRFRLRNNRLCLYLLDLIASLNSFFLVLFVYF